MSARIVRGWISPYFSGADSREVVSRSGRSRSLSYAVSPSWRKLSHRFSAAASPASSFEAFAPRGRASLRTSSRSHGMRFGRAGRGGSPVLVPGLGEGREDLVRRARLVDDATRPDGIRRPGGDELAPVVGEGLLDGLVAAAAVGRRLARDVHLLGADLLREPRDDVDGVAAPDDERAPGVLRQRRDRGEQPPGARGVVLEQPWVEDEDGQHVGGGVDGREQRRVVVQAQVAPEPQDRRRRRGHHEAAAAAPSRSNRTCATSR